MSGVVGRRVRGPMPVSVISVPILAACGLVLLSVESAGLWNPAVLLLAGCAVLGTRVSFDIEGTLFWDGSFLPIICTAALLGPLPTVTVTVASELAVWQRERYRLQVLPVNLVGTVVPNLTAAVALSLLNGAVSDGAFYVMLTAVVCVSVVMNGVIITTLAGVLYDAPILARLRRHRGIAAPIAVNVVLAVGAIAVYRAEGIAATAFVIGGVYVFAFVANRLASERDQRARISQLAESRGRLVAQILEAEDRERRALAEAIHDDLIQVLVAARQDTAESAEDAVGLTRVGHHLDHAIQQARQLVRATHPSVLERVGLDAAIRAFAEEASTRGGFPVKVALDPIPSGHFDRIVFSAVRELLGNAAKHSRAEQVAVRLTCDGDTVRLTVSDDGVGYAPHDRADLLVRGHIGLESLRERVEAVGGIMGMSSDGRGTEAVVSLPLHREEADVVAPSVAELASVRED